MAKNIVFIPAVKVAGFESRSQSYLYGINSWKYWCNKNDCELFILEDLLLPSDDMKITWQRYYIFELLETNNIEYDQILMIDADSIVHPECPNFFNLTDHKFTGVYTDGSYDWLLRSIENYSKHLFNGQLFNFWEYFMGGFQIFNKIHKPYFQALLDFYTRHKTLIQQLQNYHVGTDQPVINFLLREYAIETKSLSWEFSMADMARKEVLDEDMTFTKIGWIYQFNAIPNNTNNHLTHYWMEKTYKYLYGDK
jgi:hypothetical protein